MRKLIIYFLSTLFVNGQIKDFFTFDDCEARFELYLQNDFDLLNEYPVFKQESTKHRFTKFLENCKINNKVDFFEILKTMEDTLGDCKFLTLAHCVKSQKNIKNVTLYLDYMVSQLDDDFLSNSKKAYCVSVLINSSFIYQKGKLEPDVNDSLVKFEKKLGSIGFKTQSYTKLIGIDQRIKDIVLDRQKISSGDFFED